MDNTIMATHGETSYYYRYRPAPSNHFFKKLAKKITKVGVDIGLKKAKKEIAKEHGSEVADAMEKKLMESDAAKKAIKKVENVGTAALVVTAIGGAGAIAAPLLGGGGAAAGGAGVAAGGAKEALTGIAKKAAPGLIYKGVTGVMKPKEKQLLDQMIDGNEQMNYPPIDSNDGPLLASFGGPAVGFVIAALILLMLLAKSKRK